MSPLPRLLIKMESPKPLFPIPQPAILPVTPEKEAQQREAVIAEAMRFLRTPYRQLGDRVGSGVDCAMLLVRAWVDGGVFLPFDPRPYPPEWHLHQSEERYLAWMEALAVEVPEPKRGDVVIIHFGKCFSHGGICLGGNLIIHSFVKEGICTLADLDSNDLRMVGSKLRERKFFDIWARLRQTESPN